MTFARISSLLVLTAPVLATRLLADPYIGPAAGQKVEFLGDSITQFGWDRPTGYVHLLDLALAQEGHKVETIPAGISGQTSKDMLARIADVTGKKPDWLLISCGVNDVWHGEQGVPLDQYKINITSMVDQAKAAGAKVVILASTPIGFGDLKDANNAKLAGYNDFLRELATKDNLQFIDLNSALVEGSARLTKNAPPSSGDQVTQDGVHPNAIGYEIMTTSILKAWGYTDTQVAADRAQWEQIPNGVAFASISLAANDGMTIHDYLLLRTAAESQHKSVGEMLSGMLIADVKKVTASTSAVTPPKP